ncbi:MAG: hypothetical protein K2V38_21725 [Gemmataceae bacterium]|nr:hypothetical protein [Gemmataceae bacterium]
MKGPGYTVNDLAFYGGLMLGMSGTFLVLTNLPAYRDVLGQLGMLEFARLVTLLISGVVGIALGGFLQSQVQRYQDSRKRARGVRTSGDDGSREDYRRDYHEDRGEDGPRR